MNPIPPLFAQLPDPFAARFDPAAPWALLGEPLDEILAGLPSSEIHGQLSPDVHLVGDRIVICPGARIHPTAVIEGPIYIGRDVEIRPGAYLRGGIWIGDRCIVERTRRSSGRSSSRTPRPRTSITWAIRSSART